jgi:hypothetical protein
MCGQTESGISRHTPALAQDFANAIGRNIQDIGELMRAHTERLQKFLSENFTGMSTNAAHFSNLDDSR